MNETTEAINNIKMLKLYSWQALFERRINEKRSFEVSLLRTNQFIIAVFSSLTSFFPLIMPAVCFTVYIALGLQPYLDLPVASTCLLFFKLMAQPMSAVPMVSQMLIRLRVSMQRI